MPKIIYIVYSKIH